MTKGLIGIDPIHKDFKWLESTIKEWLEINCNYAKIMDNDDALYWYNERANVGALAGAAWRAGLYAVEELDALKTPKSPKSKRPGRIDLYLTTEEHSAVIEAKMCWFRPKTNTLVLSAKMTNARIDARVSQESNQKIGAVFYVLRIPEHELDEKKLYEMITQIRETHPQLLAWCFPDCLRNLKADQKYKGIKWPGVILAMKDARYVRKLV